MNLRKRSKVTRKSEKEERTAGTKEFEKGERTVRKGLEIQRTEERTV